jgi:hypothetical protein
VGACRQLRFSNGDDDDDDDDKPAKEHSCNENYDTSKPRTNKKKLEVLKKNKNVKRPKKIALSPVKQTLVKQKPKTLGQTKLKSCINKQVSTKLCSPVFSFLTSLSGISTTFPLPWVVAVSGVCTYIPLVTNIRLKTVLYYWACRTCRNVCCLRLITILSFLIFYSSSVGETVSCDELEQSTFLKKISIFILEIV